MGAILDMPETRGYIERFQNPNGGFSQADARTEALALDALRTLGCTDEKVYDRAREYLLTFENPDWGFSSKPGNAGSDIDGTHYVTMALKKLGVEKKEAADYVLSLHRGNGSFVRDATRPLNNPVNGKVKYTQAAVSILEVSGRDEKEVFGRAVKFLLKRRHAEGSFGECDGIFSDGNIENTYYAVKALCETGSRGMITPKTGKYLLDMQNKDGGFSSKNVEVGRGTVMGERPVWQKERSRMDETFYAISALDALGSPDKDKVRESAMDYVMSLRNNGGSFCHSRSEPGPLGEPPGTGTLLSTAYAVLTLGLLEGKPPS